MARRSPRTRSACFIRSPTVSKRQQIRDDIGDLARRSASRRTPASPTPSRRPWTRMSFFATETSRSFSSMICTVWVSSFSRRPRIVLPSRITMRTGRLIGISADGGSRIERSSTAGARAIPMSLRSGADAGPGRPRGGTWRTRPCPEISLGPRAASPTLTDALVSNPGANEGDDAREFRWIELEGAASRPACLA